MIEPMHQALIEAYVDAYNRFDVEGMLVTLADDVRFEHHVADQLAVATDGKADFEKLARVGAALFASREQTVEGIEEQGNVLIAHVHFHGEIAEDIPDGPGAGSIIEMDGTSEFAFAGGKIVRVIDRG
jgi:ketosteroid isomerase-like protein